MTGPGIGTLAQWACVAEATAPKVGNVHPRAPFADVTWRDFVVSAMVTGPILQSALRCGVGLTVWRCVRATRAAVGSNTNLGIVLLLAPLCAVPLEEPLERGVRRVLAALDERDCRLVYRAIRLARPGGLGRRDRADVHRAPPSSLRAAMGLAAEQDAVARQYVTGFRHVLRVCARWFDNARPLDESIVTAHLRQMAFEPDSLIRRKCGLPTAVECQRRAAAVLAAGFPHSASGRRRFASLDRWLRADGNRRNPGTSADLVAAGLFAALRRRRLAAPFAWSRALAEHP